MINDEKIEIVYQMIMENIILNRYNLNLRRINNLDINELIDMNIIKTIDDGIYQLVDAKGLYEYGIKLLKNKRSTAASICFYNAYKINPYDRDICMQYIVELVRKKDYNGAFEIYKNRILNIDVVDEKNNNLFLCLFSRLIVLDGELSDLVKKLSYSDILLYVNEDNKLDNEVRRNIFQSKYTYACSLMNNKTKNSSLYVVNDILIKTLLMCIIDVDKQNKLDMLDNAKNENYDLIIDMLENIKKQKKLNRTEKSILKLCKIIVNAINFERIDCCKYRQFEDIYNVYDAIWVKDYKLAMELNIDFLGYNNEDYENDVLHILLSKINMLIEEINERKQSKIIEINNNIPIKEELEPVIDMNMVIKDAEEWAYYFIESKMGIDKAIEKSGLLVKYILLVKLVLARDCYLEGNYSKGNEYLFEVEKRIALDKEVKLFLEEVKMIRNSHKEEFGYIKKLIK